MAKWATTCGELRLEKETFTNADFSSGANCTVAEPYAVEAAMPGRVRRVEM